MDVSTHYLPKRLHDDLAPFCLFLFCFFLPTAHVLNSKAPFQDKNSERLLPRSWCRGMAETRPQAAGPGKRSQAGSAMGTSGEGVLFAPRLGRAAATLGPAGRGSPRAWVRPLPRGGEAQARRERRWGGGGAGPEPRGGGAATGLLWRPTLGGGGGGDPPPSTWTVAEAWA